MKAGFKARIKSALAHGVLQIPVSEKHIEGFLKKAESRSMVELLHDMNQLNMTRMQRALFKRCEAVQRTLLLQLVRSNADTQYGRAHDFSGIHTIEDFRARVPISEWSAFEPYIDALKKGAPDILFHGITQYFARTTGTTGIVKLIPISVAEMTVRAVVGDIRNLERGIGCGRLAELISGKYRFFTMSGTLSIEKTEAGIPIGSISGMATKIDGSSGATRGINYVSPIALIIMNWVVIVIYLFGAGQVRRRIISLSDLMLIINYLAYFISSFTVISVIVNLVPKVSVSSARIMELLDYTPDMEPGTRRTGIQCGEIEFHDVGFGYSGAGEVISHVSFRAKAGETTAIIGGTGSGKTTLLNLLQGLNRMTSGDILIDGTSIRDLDPTYLLGQISHAPQKTLIFQDTIRANLTAYDDTICEERIGQALVAACFDEVVKGLPQGLDTRMAQGGMNLSGGQRQRLCLARTLAKDAPIYIFDDALSSLDAQTEQRVVSAMRAITAGRTVLIVSQKIRAVREADHIVVLDDGRIVGDGTHAELLDTCPEYRQIYQIQCYNEGKRDAQ